MDTRVSVRQGDPFEPDAKRLLQDSHDLMQKLFPPEANHYMSIDALKAPHIQFFVAEMEGDAAGCAALATYPEYGEVKSMFVTPDARGHGVGAALLARLISQAHLAGAAWLKLETGIGLDAAHRLYERHGFADCAAFGSYAANAPYSRYMERSI